MSRGRGYDAVKRVVDLATAGAILVLCLPLLGALALAVRVGLGSPVLFRQTRTGKGGALFTIVKFRTMEAPRPGAETDEDRLTRFGRFLRASSLDELPSLWNVLRGEMSLVGPRPLLPEYLPLYSEEQARRHEVKPGLTGWAQINGRNAVDWETKFALDVWYVEQRSVTLDLRILIRTFTKVLRREGVSQDGRATVDYFRGTGEAGGDQA